MRIDDPSMISRRKTRRAQDQPSDSVVNSALLSAEISREAESLVTKISEASFQCYTRNDDESGLVGTLPVFYGSVALTVMCGWLFPVVICFVGNYDNTVRCGQCDLSPWRLNRQCLEECPANARYEAVGDETRLITSNAPTSHSSLSIYFLLFRCNWDATVRSQVATKLLRQRVGPSRR